MAQTKIDEDAFMQSGIKYLKLPKNLEVISDNTFKYNEKEALTEGIILLYKKIQKLAHREQFLIKII